jgi:hypothetical protein
MSITKRTLAFAGTACFAGSLFLYSQTDSFGQAPKSDQPADPATGKATAESEDLEIQIRKDNDKPARIEVKRNGKQWSVTEKEIDKLPAAIRQRVREALRRSEQGNNGTASPTTGQVMKTTLGVHVDRVGRALQKQLKLPEGVGLLVDHVVTGSGAATAGLRRYDVLHKFDDQLLINSDQLAVLVRIRQPGDKVTLTVIREGSVAVKEAVLTAVRVTVGSTGFDAFQHFHGYQGKREWQNCAACHVGSGDTKGARKRDGIGKAFDNYEFFHGTPGTSLLNNCASCHVKAVHPLKLNRFRVHSCNSQVAQRL